VTVARLLAVRTGVKAKVGPWLRSMLAPSVGGMISEIDAGGEIRHTGDQNFLIRA